jgi:hypothetical protein
VPTSSRARSTAAWLYAAPSITAAQISYIYSSQILATSEIINTAGNNNAGLIVGNTSAGNANCSYHLPGGFYALGSADSVTFALGSGAGGFFGGTSSSGGQLLLGSSGGTTQVNLDGGLGTGAFVSTVTIGSATPQTGGGLYVGGNRVINSGGSWIGPAITITGNISASVITCSSPNAGSGSVTCGAITSSGTVNHGSGSVICGVIAASGVVNANAGIAVSGTQVINSSGQVIGTVIGPIENGSITTSGALSCGGVNVGGVAYISASGTWTGGMLVARHLVAPL